MRIATWNVNSLNKRMPRVEEWLGYAKPDVLCLQETKLSDANFPSSFSPTSTIFPSVTATSARRPGLPVPSTTVPPRTTRSAVTSQN